MRKLVVALTISVLAGCGGGGGQSAVPSAPSHSAAVVTKLIRIEVPAPKKNASRQSEYVSRNTQGIGVSFGASPFTFPSSTTPTAAFDVSGTSPLCVAGANGARTCTLTVAAPVGTDDFQVTAWDVVPTAGSFSPANALSTVTVLSQTIASGTNTSLNLTLNGIVNSVNTTVSPSSIPAFATGGTPVNATVSVNALDFYGNVIMGSGNWVDANGTALAVNVQPTSPANGGPVLTSPNAATGVTPGAPTFSVSYAGGSTWGTQFNPIVTGGSFAGSVTGATLNVTPTVTLFPLPNASSSPSFITAGPTGDNNLYFTENVGNRLGSITTAGAITEVANGQFNTLPVGIAAGMDGNIWYDAWNGAAVAAYISPSSFTGAQTTAGSLGPGYAQFGIIDGHDGYMYIAEAAASDVTRIKETAFGAAGTYATTSSAYGLVYGPDGKIWIAEQGGYVQPLTPGPTPSMGPSIAASGTPTALAVGSDGNIWVAAHGFIDVIQTSGSVANTYAVPSSLGGTSGIAPGSDGALWFTGSGGLTGGIGRITPSGVITTYFTGFGSTDDPSDMKLGPDGNLWFTEPNGNAIGRLIY